MVTKFTKHVFLVTVLLMLVVFVVGILFGNSLASSKEDEISRFIKNSELNTESYLIEQELMQSFGEEDCQLASSRISELSEELGRIGRLLIQEDAVKQLGKKDFNFLKRKYHLMQVKTYILSHKLYENCNTSANVILYFYDDNCSMCKKQGLILDEIVKHFNTKVFALHYNYSQELSFLEEYYNITVVPTIIINYDHKLEGLVSYASIKQELSREVTS